MYPSLLPAQNPSASEAVGVHHRPWEHTLLKTLSWGGLAVAGLALAPVVFSGGKGLAAASASRAIDFCTSDAASGWTGKISGLFPDFLASGGWPTALVSGGIALGGLWLANKVDQCTKQGDFRWGSVIRWTALATSMLIALPAILPAISMGLYFLGDYWNAGLLTDTAKSIGSLGAGGAMKGATVGLGAAGLAGLHALTCALPLGITGFFLGQKEERSKPMMQLHLPAHGEGRVTPPPIARRATA